jgi:hypothetical protein
MHLNVASSSSASPGSRILSSATCGQVEVGMDEYGGCGEQKVEKGIGKSQLLDRWWGNSSSRTSRACKATED